ncbi:MAG: hypothetical protein ACI87O_000001, partial [Planctomycetota bacterium]
QARLGRVSHAFGPGLFVGRILPMVRTPSTELRVCFRRDVEGA